MCRLCNSFGCYGSLNFYSADDSEFLCGEGLCSDPTLDLADPYGVVPDLVKNGD